MRTRTAALTTLCLAAGSLAGLVMTPTGATAAGAGDPSVVGSFAAPFEEAGARCTKDKDQRSLCKPAAASVAVLPTGRLVYWDALEGMEDVRYNVVAEFGALAQNDVSRQLDLTGPHPVWRVPGHVDGGANPNGNPGADYLPVVPHNDANHRNDGDLFCSDQVFLSDGRVLDVGGTSYYLEPGMTGVPYGVTELEGLKNSRIYNPVSNNWTQSGSMQYGRWYPSLVTLPNGKVFVASGVTKLIKPVYPDRPTDSGRNVTQTETYDPSAGKWSYNGASADKSLPLFPRLHLLPDGKVFYAAGGQTYNPQGQSYDEALWNMESVYDPSAKTWSDVGLPAFGPVLKGFRGSGFSQALTLKAPYTKASFLSAGGVYGVSPGSYLGTATATVDTIDTAHGDSLTSVNAAPMKEARWYGTGVTLPTGQVIVFSGASADEVVLPGSALPIRTPELYDPSTNTWTTLAPQAHSRTYHNTAVLLPDGRVLVGGHSPIATGYAMQNPALVPLGFSSPYRDPSFEIYSPPNLFYGPRVAIDSVNSTLSYGQRFSITLTTAEAARVDSVVLVRNPALTHLVDGDQRVVDLPVVSRHGDTVEVQGPPSSSVAPAGPYMLFANAHTPKGDVPSNSRQVFVGTSPGVNALRTHVGTHMAATTSAPTSDLTSAPTPATQAVATVPSAAALTSAARPGRSAFSVSTTTERTLLAMLAGLLAGSVALQGRYLAKTHRR